MTFLGMLYAVNYTFFFWENKSFVAVKELRGCFVFNDVPW